MEILIAGDLVPTGSNISMFKNGETGLLLGDELLAIWNSADIRIFNLEVPLTDHLNPICKCGPNLIAPNSCINGIKSLNPSLITLANNHIYDQDEQGLNNTIKILNENNMPFTGAGKNLSEAAKPYIIEKDGIYIGIYACAEHEFSIAAENKPGANPFDPLESLDHIKDLKKLCDFVIVLYHGGKEHYRYPSPDLQKICRKMSQKGADIIICQHSHCIGCFEKYESSTIIYGQGNFIFDYSESEFRQTSLIIRLEINKGLKINYIPVVKRGNTVRLAKADAYDGIMSAFFKRSEDILEEDFIESQYKAFAQKNIELYLTSLSGFGKWMSRIDRHLLKGKLIKHKYSRDNLLEINNYLECEAHRELLISGLKSKMTKILY